MEKRKILRCLVLHLSLFFILNLTVAEGSAILDSFKSSADEVKAKRRAYLDSIRACNGIKRAKTNRKVVAFTFDDGPNGRYTNEILDVLRANDIKATFFFVGKNIHGQEDMVRSAYADGHIIGNHSYSHRYLAKMSKKKVERELKKTGELIKWTIGKYPLLFRPPYGGCSNTSASVAEGMHLKTILWSAMVDDYNPDTTSEKIAAEIINLVKPGTIIGLHDGGGNRAKTVAALSMIIDRLKKKGYEFVNVPELLGIPAYFYFHVEKKKPAKKTAKKATINVPELLSMSVVKKKAPVAQKPTINVLKLSSVLGA